jgi:ankyrin repeat protein
LVKKIVHYALSNGANTEVIECLLKHRPNSARGFDKRGWTPLHVACGVGANTQVIERILNCYPEAVLMRTNKGSTAKQCLNLINAGNKDEVKRMLKKAFAEVEGRYVTTPKPKQVILRNDVMKFISKIFHSFSPNFFSNCSAQ